MEPKCNLNIVNLAGSSGRGMYILFSNLLRMAESKTHGIFVAPNTKMPSMSLPTPETISFYVVNFPFSVISVRSMSQGLNFFRWF